MPDLVERMYTKPSVPRYDNIRHAIAPRLSSFTCFGTLILIISRAYTKAKMKVTAIYNVEKKIEIVLYPKNGNEIAIPIEDNWMPISNHA